MLFSSKSDTLVCFGIGIKTYKLNCSSPQARRGFVADSISITPRASFAEDYIASNQVQPILDEENEHILITTPSQLFVYDLDGNLCECVVPLKSTTWQIFTINPYNGNYITQDLEQGLCYWTKYGKIITHFTFTTGQLIACYFINSEFCMILDANLNTFIIDLDTQQIFSGIRIQDQSRRFLFIRSEYPYFVTCGLVSTFYRIHTYWRLWGVLSTPIIKMQRCPSTTKAARMLFKLSDTSFHFWSPRSAQILGMSQSQNTSVPCDYYVDRIDEDNPQADPRDELIVQYEDGSMEFYQVSATPFSSIASIPKLGASSFTFGRIECVNNNRRVLIVGTKFGHVCFIDRDSLEEISQLTASKHPIVKVFIDETVKILICITANYIYGFSTVDLSYRFTYKQQCAPIMEHYWDLLVFGFSDGKLKVLQICEDKLTPIFEEQTPVHNGEITSISQGSNYMVTTCIDGSLIVWSKHLESLAKCIFPLPIYSACPLNGTRKIIIGTTKAIMMVDGPLLFDEQDEKDPILDNFDERIDDLEPNKFQFMPRSYSNVANDFIKKFWRRKNRENQQDEIDPEEEKRQAKRSRFQKMLQAKKEKYMQQRPENQVNTDATSADGDDKDGKKKELTDEDKEELLRTMMEIEKNVGQHTPTIVKEERPKSQHKTGEEENEEDEYEYAEEESDNENENANANAKDNNKEQTKENTENESTSKNNKPEETNNDDLSDLSDDDDEEQKELLRKQKEQEMRRKQQQNQQNQQRASANVQRAKPEKETKIVKEPKQIKEKEDKEPKTQTTKEKPTKATNPSTTKQPRVSSIVSKEKLPKAQKQFEGQKEVNYVDLKLDTDNDGKDSKSKKESTNKSANKSKEAKGKKSDKDKDENEKGVSKKDKDSNKDESEKKEGKTGKKKGKKGSKGKKSESPNSRKSTKGSDSPNKKSQNGSKNRGSSPNSSKNGSNAQNNQSSLLNGNKGNNDSLNSNLNSLNGNTGNDKNLNGNTENDKNLSGNAGNDKNLNGNAGNDKNLNGNTGNSSNSKEGFGNSLNPNQTNGDNELNSLNGNGFNSNSTNANGENGKDNDNSYSLSDSKKHNNTKEDLGNGSGNDNENNGNGLNGSNGENNSTDNFGSSKLRDDSQFKMIPRPSKDNIYPPTHSLYTPLISKTSYDSDDDSSGKQNKPPHVIEQQTTVLRAPRRFHAPTSISPKPPKQQPRRGSAIVMTRTRFIRSGVPRLSFNFAPNSSENFEFQKIENPTELNSTPTGSENGEEKENETPTEPLIITNLPTSLSTITECDSGQAENENLNQSYFFNYDDYRFSSAASERPRYSKSARLFGCDFDTYSARSEVRVSTAVPRTTIRPECKSPRRMTYIKQGMGHFFLPIKKNWDFADTDERTSFYPDIISPRPQKQKLSDLQAIFKRVHQKRGVSAPHTARKK